MLQSAQMLKEWFNEILYTPMEPPIRLKYRSLQKPQDSLMLLSSQYPFM